MRTEQVNEMIADITRQLLQKRSSDGIWRGCLSSSAISTSVAIFALYQIDSDTYEPYIRKGAGWLKKTMRADGSWGDSVESPSNMTATLLSYASLYAVDIPPHETETYLKERLGGNTDEDIVRGVLSYYGKDLTFSVPILHIGIVSRNCLSSFPCYLNGCFAFCDYRSLVMRYLP